MYRKNRSLRLESLEPRAMYAADLVDGVLTVTGTNRSDTIAVAPGAQAGELDVTLNGQTSPFQLADVQQILIEGKNGNDSITIAAEVLIAVSLYGGNGNDTLTGGGGNDLIHGGNGKDKLYGEAGDDTLYGNNGKDQLFGGDGNDSLDGGNGNDVCQGQIGDDRLKGKGGNDTLDGGEGDNLIDVGGGKNKRRNGASARLDNQFNVV